ncbi:MAG: hypothetical protein AAF399_11980 [Bacteroidota bacterium]
MVAQVNIDLIPAERKDKTVMRHLLELYCYDASEYLGTDVNEHGLFEYPHVDVYWMEEGRQAFFIQVEGKYA